MSRPEYARTAADEILATRRAEALALFEANQLGRTRASGVLALAFLATATAGTVGIACHAPELAIPLPTVLLLLFAELCQHYVDVNVIGAARYRLEDAVNAELGATSLVYETLIASIRKRAPLVQSERVLQGAGAVVVLASVAVGALVTYRGQPVWVELLYPFCTALAAWVASLSYRAMLASGRVAAEALVELDHEMTERLN